MQNLGCPGQSDSIFTEGDATGRTFCVWCEDDNVVEVRCVILLDRGGAVSGRTKGKTVPLFYDRELNK